MATFEFSIEFYAGMWMLVAFIRQLISWTVTPSLGPIVSTIMVMFNDVGRFIIIWAFVILGFSCVGFITFRDVPAFNKLQFAIEYFY